MALARQQVRVGHRTYPAGSWPSGGQEISGIRRCRKIRVQRAAGGADEWEGPRGLVVRINSRDGNALKADCNATRPDLSGSRGTDRRRKPTPLLSRHTVRGRRRCNRRAADPRSGYYVDWVEGNYRVAVLAVGAFILLDAVATLEILSRGGTEANPLMALLLGHSIWSFLLVKVTGACAAVLVLGAHRHFPSIRRLGALLLAAYGSIALYHLLLLAMSTL